MCKPSRPSGGGYFMAFANAVSPNAPTPASGAVTALPQNAALNARQLRSGNKGPSQSQLHTNASRQYYTGTRSTKDSIKRVTLGA